MAIVPTKSDRLLKQEFLAFAANGMKMSCKGRKTHHRGIHSQAGFAKPVRKWRARDAVLVIKQDNHQGLNN